MRREKEIRQAVADYMVSGGCSCCERLPRKEHREKLAKLLRVPKYKDGSGYDFYRFASKEPKSNPSKKGRERKK